MAVTLLLHCCYNVLCMQHGVCWHAFFCFLCLARFLWEMGVATSHAQLFQKSRERLLHYGTNGLGLGCWCVVFLWCVCLCVWRLCDFGLFHSCSCEHRCWLVACPHNIGKEPFACFSGVLNWWQQYLDVFFCSDSIVWCWCAKMYIGICFLTDDLHMFSNWELLSSIWWLLQVCDRLVSLRSAPWCIHMTCAKWLSAVLDAVMPDACVCVWCLMSMNVCLWCQCLWV